MNSEVIIRKMNQDDLLTVIQIENRSFSDPWTYESFLNEITNSLSHYIIIELNDEIIGYAGSWIYLDEIHITNISVETSKRNLGFGKILLSALLNEAAGRNVLKAFLEVRKSNTNAIKLYERFGFIRIFERKKYYKNNEDAVVMLLSPVISDMVISMIDHTIHKSGKYNIKLY